MRKILIASASYDVPSFLKVIDILKKSDAHPILYEVDKVAHGESSFTFEIDKGGGAHFAYNNCKIPLDTLHAAWCRRSYAYEYPAEIDRLLANGLGREASHIHDGIWNCIPDKQWLNAPRRMQWAENKLTQLRAAAKVGFTIPQTVISNNWSAIENIDAQQLIIKPAYSGALWHKNGLKFLHSTLAHKNTLHKLKASNPFPSFYQPYVQKAKEWRVTVVGDKVFPAAIYAKGKAKHDWRYPTDNPKDITYKKEPFDSKTAQQCIQLLKRLRLRFGAFDFIESNDGTISFLEVNPAGQYAWLEEILDLPISRAIADELLNTEPSAV